MGGLVGTRQRQLVESASGSDWTKAEVRSVHAQRIWPVLTYATFLCSVLLAHFVTRCLGEKISR